MSAQNCRRCPLWERASQTVFGAGAAQARILFVGEQPGDVEDRQGLPFIGPAGKMLDRALHEAQIERERCYVTNAVKHFKWEPLGGAGCTKDRLLGKSRPAVPGCKRRSS